MSGLDRHRAGVRLVDGTVPRGLEGRSGIDLEGPQVNLFRRLTVRRKESGPQIETPPGPGTHSGLLHELQARPRCDPPGAAIARLQAARHGLDQRSIALPIFDGQMESRAQRQPRPESDLAHHHQTARPTLQIERKDRHGVHAATMQDLEPVGPGRTAIAVQILREKTLQDQKPRTGSPQAFENPKPHDASGGTDDDDVPGAGGWVSSAARASTQRCVLGVAPAWIIPGAFSAL